MKTLFCKLVAIDLFDWLPSTSVRPETGSIIDTHCVKALHLSRKGKSLVMLSLVRTIAEPV